LWRVIDDFLITTEKGPRPVEDLYQVLKAPPFGAREGVLPIYLITAMLHWQSAVALYEKGSFIPDVGPAECERLMKLPETFSVQRYQLDDARQHMLYEYSTLLDDELDPRHISQLTAVRPIIAFANQLPRYTQLTRSLSKEAIAVREALLSAHEPQRLLLDELPKALGFEVPESNAEDVEMYFSDLRQRLVELQGAYEKLLTEIRQKLVDALLLPSDLDAARQEVTPRARLLRDWVADLELKAFVSRLGDDELAHREWLESLASCLVHKPPSKWNDDDVLAYQVALTDISARFRRTEELALVQGAEHETMAGQAVRLGVTHSTGREQREIVRIAPDHEEKAEEAVDLLREALQSLSVDRKTQVMALAELVRETLRSLDSPEEACE
jgi:hypothetical protein